MQQDDLLYLLALKLTPGIGPVTAQNLIAYCKSPQKVFSIPKGKLLSVPEIGPKTAALIHNKDALLQAEQELKYCHKEGIRVLAYTDPEYPALLKQIPDLPLILFVKGNTPLNQIPWIAVVGTRNPDEYGRNMSKTLCAALTRSGAGILSGLAFGIDQEAHRACLAENGYTAAVLGHGLDRIYPFQHKALSEKILAQGGVLITEYTCGTKPDAVNFPTRNRIVAGMCRAVLVIQAAAKGGALITAKLGFDYDREIFAVPGDLTRRASEGCNDLIRNQYARLIHHPGEILDLLKIQEIQGPPASSAARLQSEGVLLSVDEKRILSELEKGEMILDELAQKLEQNISQMQVQLLALEIKGIVRILPGRKVVLL